MANPEYGSKLLKLLVEQLKLLCLASSDQPWLEGPKLGLCLCWHCRAAAPVLAAQNIYIQAACNKAENIYLHDV